MTEPQRPFGAPTEIDADEAERARLQNRFDIRRIIGALFVLYGVVLVVTGIVGSHAVKTKADGINVDLWVGLAMLVFGVLMVAWALWRPVVPDPPEHEGRGSGRLRRSPAT
jgi:NADH:ubiquinone oxidoreductase subunit 6 (subunit J)